VDRIIEYVNQDPSCVNKVLERVAAPALAWLLKKFLSGLPEPLMTSKLSGLFLAAASEPFNCLFMPYIP
jgi:hypothetical protein